MMNKIEREAEIKKTIIKIVRYAWICIFAGVILLVLGNIFDRNPVIEFLEGAMPGE